MQQGKHEGDCAKETCPWSLMGAQGRPCRLPHALNYLPSALAVAPPAPTHPGPELLKLLLPGWTEWGWAGGTSAICPGSRAPEDSRAEHQKPSSVEGGCRGWEAGPVRDRKQGSHIGRRAGKSGEQTVRDRHGGQEVGEQAWAGEGQGEQGPS